MSKESLEKDPNIVAYKSMEAELKEKYMGKWVAFVNGQLAVMEDDKTTLFKSLNSQFPKQGGFIHHIVEVEPIFHFRSPRIIRKRD